MAEIEDKKKEVAPLEKVPGQSGPATIFCDPNLESSLQFETNQDHYIGRLEGDSDFEGNAAELLQRQRTNLRSALKFL